MAFKLALSSANKMTPFACLAILGTILCALGAVQVYLSVRALNFVERFGHDPSERYGNIADWVPSEGPIRPDERYFRAWLWLIRLFENGYYVFLAGTLFLAVGVFPFVVAASR